jgi:hypothetical protein
LLYKELNPDADQQDPQLQLPFGDQQAEAGR